MAEILIGLGLVISTMAGIAVLGIDAANRVQCEMQCLVVPPSPAMRWAGIVLLIGPWILMGIFMRCKESFNG